ncbi:hypothetical protein TWF481_001053 [Arthrobotrys musiformis]|uniref:Stig1 n=1 Tax=Arthrobotrys musiformis TaxID=47236 RepID=A0AAV9WQJ2_9PEZI
MKLLSVVLGASLFIGALALSRSGDTLEIQNSNSPSLKEIEKASLKPKSRKPKTSSSKNRIDVFTKPRSCTNQGWYCENFVQCADCDGICQIEDGEETGICVDKPKKCTDLYTDCKTSEDCGFCGGICDILEGEKFGLCVGKEEMLENQAHGSSRVVIIISK